MDHRQSIVRSCRAFQERDSAALHAILPPDFHHVSSFGEWRDRDAMLAATWPAVGQSWAANLRIFGAAPSFMVRYHQESLAAIHQPLICIADCMSSDGDEITGTVVDLEREAAGIDGV